MLHLFDKALLIAITMFAALIARGQDPVFSQFYLNQNYINPAFAGHTSDFSVSLNSRLQYVGIPGVLATNTLAANIGCSNKESILGLGVIVYDHVEGEGLLHTFNFSGQLSANIQWNTKNLGANGNKALLAGGLQFGLGQKFIDWSRLTFSDQYSPYFDGIQNATYVAPQLNSSNVFLDLGGGVRGMFEFSTPRRPRIFQYGLSVFHINKPVQSFLNTSLQLEPRYSFFAFTHISDLGQRPSRSYNRSGLKHTKRFWTIGFLADYQQGMQSHTFSASREVNKYFTGGFGYRRQYFFQADKHIDAFIINTFIILDDWSIGLSYDWTLSTLGEEKTFGTIEIGLRYVFEGINTCKRKRDKCPTKGFKIGHEVPKLSM